MVSAWRAAVASYTYIALILFVGSVTWSPTTNQGNLTEANFGGYARISGLTPSAAQWDAVNGISTFNFGLQTFNCNGQAPSNQVTGAAVIFANGGTTSTVTPVITSNVLTGMTITNGGTLYEAPPVATFGGTYTTAPVITFTVTNGVVTGYTISSGGTGLQSNFTITLTPPTSILTGGNFPAAVSMAVSTDFINTTPQVQVPTVSVA